MHYKKDYQHLTTSIKKTPVEIYESPDGNGTPDTGTAKVRPSAPHPAEPIKETPPSFYAPVRTQGINPLGSFLKGVAFILAAVLVAYLIYRALPGNFEACRTFPGSRLENTLPATCTTFYGSRFYQSIGDLEVSPTPASNGQEIFDDFPTPTPVPPVQIITGTDTTKGGVVPQPTSSPRPTSVPTQAITPVPTTSADSTQVGSDWVRHRYPTQNLAFWLPKNWTGSVATYNRDTQITTFSLGGDTLKVTLQPNWNNTGNAKDQAINYEVKGNSAIKITGQTHTTVYFERASKVHIFACQNAAWSTCHIILQNLEFTN
jgi:hypothetical protein